MSQDFMSQDAVCVARYGACCVMCLVLLELSYLIVTWFVSLSVVFLT